MSIESLSTEDKARLKHLVTEGIRTLQEVQDLKEGLSDLVTSVSKELGINKKVLTTALKVGFKKTRSSSVLEEEKETISDVEYILDIADGK